MKFPKNLITASESTCSDLEKVASPNGVVPADKGAPKRNVRSSPWYPPCIRMIVGILTSMATFYCKSSQARLKPLNSRDPITRTAVLRFLIFSISGTTNAPIK